MADSFNDAHRQAHETLEQWCRCASNLMEDMVHRVEALEQETANLRARVAEWEVGPR